MNSKRTVLRSLGGALAWAVAAPAAQARPAAKGPRRNNFPNVLVHTHEGERVRFYDDLVRGKRVMFNMMYTSCSGICPGSTANLLQVQNLLGGRVGRDMFMYSLTLQPEFDRPQDLAAYVKRYGIKPGWKLITGVPREMDMIRRRLGFYDRDPVVDADLTQHTGMVRIGNEKLDRWCMAPTLGSPKHIARAILQI